jgi:hypothetical protein
MVAADGFQRAVWRSSRAHVVLGVNLEEIDAAGAGEDVVAVLGLEPDSGGRWCIQRRK